MQSDYSEPKELEALQDIIHSSEWKAFVRLLDIHSQYLQKQVNICLRQHEDRKAGEWLAKMDECTSMAELIKTRVKKLREQQEGK